MHPDVTDMQATDVLADTYATILAERGNLAELEERWARGEEMTASDVAVLDTLDGWR